MAEFHVDRPGVEPERLLCARASLVDSNAARLRGISCASRISDAFPSHLLGNLLLVVLLLPLLSGIRQAATSRARGAGLPRLPVCALWKLQVAQRLVASLPGNCVSRDGLSLTLVHFDRLAVDCVLGHPIRPQSAQGLRLQPSFCLGAPCAWAACSSQQQTCSTILARMAVAVSSWLHAAACMQMPCRCHNYPGVTPIRSCWISS
mmetsp:Transcript_70004/g.193639  ORF Transcript_70004/g.193639 Transcript_70004/m.193639 type:complete len:205 (+) Transcript_70004:323-937(+)